MISIPKCKFWSLPGGPLLLRTWSTVITKQLILDSISWFAWWALFGSISQSWIWFRKLKLPKFVLTELKERIGIQIHMYVSTNMFNEFGDLAFVMPCYAYYIRHHIPCTISIISPIISPIIWCDVLEEPLTFVWFNLSINYTLTMPNERRTIVGYTSTCIHVTLQNHK